MDPKTLPKPALIPKIIHYVWVGGKPLTPLAQHCINSWKKYLPEYEIKRWDETNSPMNHQYVKAMYAQKKWAFVSDYIRFWALSGEGGIYLDTDLEVFKSLDDFLPLPGFVGMSKSGQIESSIIGAAPGASFVRVALKWYDQDTEHSILNTSPLILEHALATVENNTVTVFDYSYFHPINDGEILSAVARAHAYGVHHWAESWVPYAGLRKLVRRFGLMEYVKKIKTWL